MRTPRWVPVIERVKEALEYASQHRTKNSPRVFTNPRMVVEYLDNPHRWRYIYWDKFLATLCGSAGVPRMGYHNLRHRATSNMITSGGPTCQKFRNSWDMSGPRRPLFAVPWV